MSASGYAINKTRITLSQANGMHANINGKWPWCVGIANAPSNKLSKYFTVWT